MVNVYVCGTADTVADVSPNRWKQVQNFNWIPRVTVIAHNCAFIDFKQRAKCRMWFRYYGEQFGFKPSFKPKLIRALVLNFRVKT